LKRANIKKVGCVGVNEDFSRKNHRLKSDETLKGNEKNSGA